MKMFGLANNITDLGSTRIHMGKTNTYADNQHQGSISIKRHFLRGLLFASSFCYYLNTDIDGVATSKHWVLFGKKVKSPGVNHLLFINDLKFFAKNESQIDYLSRLYAFIAKTSVWNLVLQTVLC